MLAKDKNLFHVGLATIILFMAVLACAPLTGGGAVTVVINSPASGSTVMVGQEVLIDSTITARAGVERVDLAISGAVVRYDTPPSGNPTTFRVTQPWVPGAEGQVTVAVVGYDVNGESQQATVTLQVAASAAGGPTAVPGATAVPGPVATAVPPVTTEAGCGLNASYVADVTVPDNTEVSPGSSFVKTWRIRNSGTCDWTAGYKLVFVGGQQMNGEAQVAVPPTAAGSTADVSVNLTAPVAPGTYKGNWRMQSDEGLAFGSTFYVQVVVPAPVTDTPVPTDTPIPPTVAAPVEVDIVADADAYWWPKNMACVAGSCPDFGGSSQLELTNRASGSGGFAVLYPGLVAVHFDLGGIPAGAAIEGATLHLYLDSASGAGSVDLSVRRAVSPWSESDHAVKPGCETSGGVSRSVGSGSGWYDWDVKSAVEYQHANPTTNYGFCVTGGGADNTRVFRSREGVSASRPYLRVVYQP
jgi:hypothetical protein